SPLISANGTPASLLRLLAHQAAQRGDQLSELRVADRVGQGQRALLARGRDGDRVGVPVGAALLRRGLLPLEELRPLDKPAEIVPLGPVELVRVDRRASREAGEAAFDREGDLHRIAPASLPCRGPEMGAGRQGGKENGKEAWSAEEPLRRPGRERWRRAAWGKPRPVRRRGPSPPC